MLADVSQSPSPPESVVSDRRIPNLRPIDPDINEQRSEVPTPGAISVMRNLENLRKLVSYPESVRSHELWGSFFDLWFLIPLVGLMVNSEQGGTAQNMGADLLVMGGAWLLSALLFRTSIPLQPLKVWAFLFLILHPTPFVASISAVILGLLILLCGQMGISAYLEKNMSEGSLLRVRRSVGLYVRAIAIASLGITFFRDLPFMLPSGVQVRFSSGLEFAPSPLLAVFLLVLPQLPVTLVNGILSTVRERRQSGVLALDAQVRLSGRNLSLWLGFADSFAGLLGVLPFCHGSGNLWIYRRHGVRSALPSLVSSFALIGIGTMLWREAILPSPIMCGSFLAGFLIVEFFLKKKEKNPAGCDSGPSGTLSGTIEIWAAAGGMISGSFLLGGLPILLAFLLGVNAAIIVSLEDAGGTYRYQHSKPCGGSDGIFLEGATAISFNSVLVPRSNGPDHPLASLLVTLHSEAHEPVRTDVQRKSIETPFIQSERFFRRPREIPIELVILFILFIFSLLSPTLRLPLLHCVFPRILSFRSLPIRAP